MAAIVFSERRHHFQSATIVGKASCSIGTHFCEQCLKLLPINLFQHYPLFTWFGCLCHKPSLKKCPFFLLMHFLATIEQSLHFRLTSSTPPEGQRLDGRFSIAVHPRCYPTGDLSLKMHGLSAATLG